MQTLVSKEGIKYQVRKSRHNNRYYDIYVNDHTDKFTSKNHAHNTKQEALDHCTIMADREEN